MSAMDLLCEPKTLVAEVGKLFSKVCNFRHFGDATFSIFACPLGYLYYAINKLELAEEESGRVWGQIMSLFIKLSILQKLHQITNYIKL